jgi:hypothetical protein
LPDGIFSNQNSKFGYIFEGLAVEDVGIFYGHLFYFTAIGFILSAFVNFVVLWYIFLCNGMLYQETSGNPDSSTTR